MKVDQATILDNYRGWLRKMAAHLISDPHLQQDLAQEGWIEMWRAFQTFDPARGALPAWLTFKALNRMRDCARDRAWLGRPTRYQGGHHKVSDTVEYAASDTPVWELLEAADLLSGMEWAYHHGEVMAAIAALPYSQRRYTYLRFWRGYRLPELRAEFGYDPNALWNHPRYGAKVRLRHSLQRLGA